MQRFLEPVFSTGTQDNFRLRRLLYSITTLGAPLYTDRRGDFIPTEFCADRDHPYYVLPAATILYCATTVTLALPLAVPLLTVKTIT